MDSSDPSIIFDEQGISNHYWDYQNNVRPNLFGGNLGRTRLQMLIDHIKRSSKNSDFDCIIGLSGGLDSSFLLHTVVKEYGLRPLVFHVDGGWNSNIAVSNISSIVNKLGLNLYTEVIDWQEMANFQHAMFKAGVPHLDTPQDLAFVGVLYKFAAKYSIKYILNGGNIVSECVARPLKYIYYGTDMKHIRAILKEFGSTSMNTFPFSSIFYHKIYLRYLRRIKVVKPLNYIDFNKSDAIKLLSNSYGWRPYLQKHYESSFTRFFEGYWLRQRFGFDMRRVEYSSLILNGQMTREDALSNLKSPPYSDNDMRNDFNFVASKLSISQDQLHSYLSLPLRFYSDYPNNYQLISLGERLLTKFTSARRGGAF